MHTPQLVDISYDFWETPEERVARLEGLWGQAKEAREEKTRKEAMLYSLYADVVGKLRELRWKFDQKLESVGMDPLFKDLYLSYRRDELLLSAPVSFRKIKMLLERSPTELAQDPEVAPHLEKINQLIQKVALLEETTPGYYSTDGTYHWHIVPPVSELARPAPVIPIPEEDEDPFAIDPDLREDEEVESDRFIKRRKAQEQKLRLIADLRTASDTLAREDAEHANTRLPPGRAGERKTRGRRQVILNNLLDEEMSEGEDAK